MKSFSLFAAVFGALALASPNASASTDSTSFHVRLTLAAPCEVSTPDTATGGEPVAVRCRSASTPYRLEPGAPAIGAEAQEAQVDENDGQSRMTLTF